MDQLEEIMRLTRQNYDRNVKLDGNYDMARKNSYVVMAEHMNLPRQNLVLPKNKMEKLWWNESKFAIHCILEIALEYPYQF